MKSKIFLLMVTFICTEAFASKLDSLKHELEGTTSSEGKIELLIKIAYEEKNLEKSYQYIREAYDLIKKKTNNDTTHAKIIGLMAKNLSFRGKLSAADSALALIEVENVSSDKLQAFLLNVSGDILYRKGEFKKASEVFFEAYKKAEIAGDSEQLGHVFNNLGRVFWRIGNLNKAKEYFKKSYQQALIINNLSYQAAGLGNLGLLYKDQVDSAIHYYQKSQKIYETLKDTFQMAINLQNLGVAYQKKENYNQAFSSFEAANQYYQSVGDSRGEMLATYNLATISFEIGEEEKGLEYFNKAEKMAKDNNYKSALMQLYYHLGMAYNQVKQPQKAYDYLSQHVNLKDSIMNADHKQVIEELEVQYETEKKERELLQSNLLVNQKDNQLKVISLIGIASLASLVFIFVIMRQRRENHYQKQSLIAITETQEKERQRIARDLHDSVGSMLATFKNDISEKIDDAKDIKILDQISDELRQISHSMMPASLEKFGLTAAIKSELERVKTLHQIEVEYNEFGVEGKINKESQVHIYRIIQEAIQNILKHSNASRISISLTGSEDNLNLLIEDNGKGFQIKSSSLGLGLSNMIIRAENILKGKLKIDSNQKIGTIININLPLA